MAVDTLVQECKRISEDSLYTAQAHFETARLADLRERWVMLIVPSFIAAVSSILVAVGPAEWKWLAAVAAAASLVATVAGYLRVDERATLQTQAGNAFTILRHQARLLAELANTLELNDLHGRITRLTERYEDLVRATPSTDNRAFNIARNRVKQGIFLRDE
jgi:hypothetical protein